MVSGLSTAGIAGEAMKYLEFFTKERRRSLMVGIFIFALAIIFQFYASAYSSRVASTAVHDLFLDNLPVFNLNAIIVEGALTAIVFTLIFILYKPSYLIFTLKSAAIFIATRAVFISVTHLGIYPGQAGPDPTGFADRIYTGLGLEGGFFFSGHVGLTFLMALILWDKKSWRYVYIIMAVVFAVSVILAHIHYSIDVLAAPFMTYAIFKISQYFFPEDYRLVEGAARH